MTATTATNHTTRTHTHTQEQKLTEIDESPRPLRSSLLFFSSSLLILHCPPRATIVASTLPSPLHTTTRVIQSLTRVSAGPTKTNPPKHKTTRRERCAQQAATVQHRSDSDWTRRRHKHCDKHSTVKDGFNEQADTSG